MSHFFPWITTIDGVNSFYTSPVREYGLLQIQGGNVIDSSHLATLVEGRFS